MRKDTIMHFFCCGWVLRLVLVVAVTDVIIYACFLLRCLLALLRVCSFFCVICCFLVRRVSFVVVVVVFVVVAGFVVCWRCRCYVICCFLLVLLFVVGVLRCCCVLFSQLRRCCRLFRFPCAFDLAIVVVWCCNCVVGVF